MFKGACYYFALCWKYNKGYPIVLVFKEILNAVKAVMMVVLPKFIIDALFTAQNKNNAIQFLIIYVASLFAISLLTAVFDRFSGVLTGITFQRFQANIGKGSWRLITNAWKLLSFWT